ncbi:MAG: sulfotransferase domain-containing protein, partial [Cyanobacteria bacterium J06626_14]
ATVHRRRASELYWEMSSSLDLYWLNTIEFVTRCFQQDETVLAPNILKDYLQGCQFKGYQTTFQGTLPHSLSGAVVHKGMIDQIAPAVLGVIDQLFIPVFANEVFVVFSRVAYLDAGVEPHSKHLQAYWNLRAQQQSVIGSKQVDGHLSKQELVGISTRTFVPNIDVLLCSYRKCGRTWLRYMLAFYINERCQLGYEPSLDTMVMLVPPFTVTHKVPLDSIQTSRYAGKLGLKAIAASHQSYDNPQAPKNLKGKDIIFLFRAVCDVLVSQYFERVFRRGAQPRETVWAFIQSELLLEAYVSYLNAWADNLEHHRHLILTYEEMKADTTSVVCQVLQFIGTDIDRDALTHAIHLSSFEQMQQMERREMGLESTSAETNLLRTRRGKIGGYRDYLSEEAVVSIRQYCEKNLSTKARTMFETHQLDVS